MQLGIAADQLHGFGARDFGVIRRVLCHLVTCLVSGVVRQNIHDEAFFDGLPHAVNMERVEGAVRPFLAEDLQCFILWRSGKGVEAEVLMLSCGDQLLQELVVLGIQIFLRFSLQLRILSQRLRGVSECHF